MSAPPSDRLRELLLHDLRAPLAVISGSAQLLRRRAVAGRPDVRELLRDLDRIDTAAKRVEELLDELARLPRPDDTEHRAQGTTSAVDLVALAARVAAQAPALGRQRVVVVPSVTALIGAWKRARLEHLLANLIGNALKYSPEDRDVVLTIHRCDDWAVLRVADHGVGSPADEVRRVFDYGYRATNVVGQFPGTGLGLAGAHQIAAEHGGAITIESELGVGTTVTVRLPITGTGTADVGLTS